jgi:hypothetical protein
MNEGVSMTDPRIEPVRAQLQKYATAEEVLAAADAVDPARAALARVVAILDDEFICPVTSDWRAALDVALGSDWSH